MLRREAALEGAGEIGFTILSISISLVAVFIIRQYATEAIHESSMIQIINPRRGVDSTGERNMIDFMFREKPPSPAGFF